MVLELENAQNTTPYDEQEDSFAALLDAYDYASPERGQILEGIILEATDREIILDVGLKRDAVVSRQDLERMDDDVRQSLTPGTEVQAWVLKPYTYEDELVVSINKALELEDWKNATELLESQGVSEVQVLDQNRGGLLVRFGRLRGFVPNSHIANIHRTTPRSKTSQMKDNLVGEIMNVKVIEVNRRQNRLVMSEREVMQEMRQQRMRQIEVGTILTGHVVHIVDFGAFVDIGGVDGLIHISNLDHRHVNHPSEVVAIGDEVQVRVNKIDVERERIDLDRKSTLPDPWDVFIERYGVEELITGTVTNVVDYGIFVALPGGAQGLVHTNNMSMFNISSPRDMFKEGDEVLVRVMDIDVAQKRIALSVDAVTVDEQEDWMYSRREEVKTDDTEAEDGTSDEETVVAEADAPVEEATEAGDEETVAAE